MVERGVHLPHHRQGVRAVHSSSVAALERRHKGFRHSVRLRTANGVVSGSSPISRANERVSRAMQDETLSVSHSMRCCGEASSKRLYHQIAHHVAR